MINCYYEVNWEATKERIRNICAAQWRNAATAQTVLADAMHETPETIYNLIKRESRLQISHLMLIARYFGVDVSDLVVLNGDGMSLTRDEIMEYLESVNPDNDITTAQVETNIEQHVHDFRAGVILNEYARRSNPIRNLKHFLVYLPLCNILDLTDMLIRLQGNLTPLMDPYFQSQLQELYRGIPESPAKQFANDLITHELGPSYYQNQAFGESEYMEWAFAPGTLHGCHEYMQQLKTYVRKLQLAHRIVDQDQMTDRA